MLKAHLIKIEMGKKDCVRAEVRILDFCVFDFTYYLATLADIFMGAD